MDYVSAESSAKISRSEFSIFVVIQLFSCSVIHLLSKSFAKAVIIISILLSYGLGYINVYIVIRIFYLLYNVLSAVSSDECIYSTYNFITFSDTYSFKVVFFQSS